MKTTTKKRKTISLPIKMMVGMILGLAVGMVVGPSIAVIKPLGTAFINLLKMSMVPVVFFSITLSIATVDDLKSFGRFGIKTFIAYVVTTVIAAAVAIFYGFLIKPGAGFAGNISGGAVEREMPTLADTLLGIIPTNIIQSLADGNLVSIIFFCILFGIGIAMLSEERKKPAVCPRRIRCLVPVWIPAAVQAAPRGRPLRPQPNRRRCTAAAALQKAI